MVFKQKTLLDRAHIHSMEDNYSIGQGSAMTMGQAPYGKPTISQMKSREAEQHTADVLEGDASPTGWY